MQERSALKAETQGRLTEQSARRSSVTAADRKEKRHLKTKKSTGQIRSPVDFFMVR